MARHKVTFSRSDVRIITRMFVKERKTTSFIGKLFGVSCNTIIKTLRDNGVEVNLSNIRTKYFSPKQVSDIIRLYANGLGESTVSLGKMFDCSYATIRRVLKEHEAYCLNAPPRNKILFSDEDKAKILNDYSKGASAVSLARHFGCGDSVIRGFLQRCGIDTCDYGRGHRKTLIRDTGLYRTCRSLSRRIYNEHKDYINPKGHHRHVSFYHVDHKLSLNEGFLLDLTVLDLAHPFNLQMVTAKYNLSKHKKSSISKRDLLNGIKLWNKTNGDPFTSINMEIKYSYRYGRYRYFSGAYTHFIRYHK
jgi:hypothetical protein